MTFHAFLLVLGLVLFFIAMVFPAAGAAGAPPMEHPYRLRIVAAGLLCCWASTLPFLRP